MEKIKDFLVRIKNLTRKEKTKEHLKRIKQIQETLAITHSDLP